MNRRAEDKYARTRARLNLSYELPKGVVIKVADTREELAAAFSILHDSYVESGFMVPAESKMRLNIYQALPTTSTLVAKKGDEVLATMSAVADTPLGMPIDKIYDVSDLRATNRRLVEISGLAVRKDHRTDHGLILFAMVKYMYHYTERWMHADRAVISVNPKHQNFYEHILLFDRLESAVVESYDFANNAPAVCLTTDLTNYRERFMRVYGDLERPKNLFEYICLEETTGMIFPERLSYLSCDPVMSPELLEFFFLQKSSALEKLNVTDLRTFSGLYRLPAFEPVLAKLHGGIVIPGLRQDQRYQVCIPTRAMRSMGSSHFYPNLTILSVGAGGVGARVAVPLGESRYQTTLELGGHPLQAVLEPKWQNGLQCGFQLVDGSDGWERLIAALEDSFQRNWSQRPAKVA